MTAHQPQSWGFPPETKRKWIQVNKLICTPLLIVIKNPIKMEMIGKLVTLIFTWKWVILYDFILLSSPIEVPSSPYSWFCYYAIRLHWRCANTHFNLKHFQSAWNQEKPSQTYHFTYCQPLSTTVTLSYQVILNILVLCTQWWNWPLKAFLIFVYFMNGD